MGQAFDHAGFHGTNSPFGAGMNLDAATLSVELGTAAAVDGGLYADLVSGMELLTGAKKRLRGFAFDGSVEPMILGAVDAQGRPIFAETLDDATGPITSGRLLRRPAVLADIDSAILDETSGVVGYGGDFSKIVWGAVGGITYDVSTEATVTINGELTSLWEHNLVAIRAEAEFGLLIDDTAAFVKFTNAA
jgi:HK97 family phage major capsid protein